MVTSTRLQVVLHTLQIQLVAEVLKKDWLVIMTMCFLQLFSGSVSSLPMAFYPQVAIQKRATATEYGFVFGIYHITGIFYSLVLGKYVANFGMKTMLAIAVGLTSLSSIFFGLLEYIRSHIPFIVLSLLLRIAEGIGSHSIKIALATAAAGAFPEKKGTVLATVSSSYTVGCTLGPALGSLIFEVGGYMLPFVILGLALILSGLASIFFIPNNPPPSASISPVSMRILVVIPGVMFGCFCITFGCFSTTFITAVLAPRLDNFHLNVITKGLIFTITTFVLSISAPIFGRISDKHKRLKRFLLVGNAISIASFILLGPAPNTGIPENLTVLIVGLVLQGFSLAILLTFTRNDSIYSAVAGGQQDGAPLFGALSGMWTASGAFGSFAGASLSGYLYDTVGFQYGSLVVIAFFTCLTIFNIVLLITTEN